MGVDLRRQPVTDIHCFSFAPGATLAKGSFGRMFMAGGPTVMSYRPALRQRDLSASVAYRRMIHELSIFLHTADGEAEVFRRRNETGKDFATYVGSLFKDAGIERIVLDNGIEPVRFDDFRRLVPAKIYRVFRIEPLLKNLLTSSRSFGDLLDSFDDAVLFAVRKDGFVGFKSVIAYRTGLEVGAPDETEARRSFQAHRKGKEQVEWFGPRVKPLRDFLLRRVAGMSGRLGAFLQIHTGLGDTDVIADKCNPLLLKNFLKLEEVSKIPVILIHGGFPYTAEAAWLASVFPNVYFELSTPFPPTFLPALGRRRFRDVLEIVPTSRIIYGSDAIETPENHWLSARMAKQALGEALGDLVAEGTMDEDEARKGGAQILDSNGRELLAR